MANNIRIIALVVGLIGSLQISATVPSGGANRWIRRDVAPGESRWDLPWGSYFDVVQDCVYLCVFDTCTLRCVGFDDNSEARECSNTKDLKACKSIWGFKFFHCGSDCPAGSTAL